MLRRIGRALRHAYRVARYGGQVARRLERLEDIGNEARRAKRCAEELAEEYRKRREALEAASEEARRLIEQEAEALNRANQAKRTGDAADTAADRLKMGSPETPPGETPLPD